MEIKKIDAEGREFINSVHWLKENNRPGYFAIASLIYANRKGGMDGFPAVEAMFKSATRGEFKRAIRYLREFQSTGNYHEKYRDAIELVIAYIRREWLHRGCAFAGHN